MTEQAPGVTFDQQGDVVVLKFENVSLLDDASYKLLSERIDGLDKQNIAIKGLVVSMEGIKLVSTAIWGKLFVLNRKLQKNGGALAICALGPLLRDAVRVLRLDRLLCVVDTVDEGIREVKF